MVLSEIKSTGFCMLDHQMLHLPTSNLSNQVVFSDHLNNENRRDLIFLDVTIESEARRILDSTRGLGHYGTLWSL